MTTAQFKRLGATAPAPALNLTGLPRSSWEFVIRRHARPFLKSPHYAIRFVPHGRGLIVTLDDTRLGVGYIASSEEK